MTKYYHLTNVNNLKSIFEKGLIPSNGPKSQAFQDEKTAVCFSKDEVFTIIMYYSFLFFYEDTTGSVGKYELRDAIGKLEKYRTGPENSKRYSPKDIEELKRRITQIKEMGKFASFDDFMGDNIYLEVDDIPVIDNGRDFHDCYTEEIVPPEAINIATLKNKKTGELVTKYKKIMFYLFGLVGMDGIKKAYEENFKTMFDEIDPDSYDDIINLYYMYYNFNQGTIKRLHEEYEIIYMPLSEYLALTDSSCLGNNGRK